MKFLTLTIFTLLSLALTQTYADTNTTQNTEKKTEINDQDKLKEALATLETDLKNTKTENNITIAIDYNKVGFYYSKTEQTEKALEYYLKAVKIVEDQKRPNVKKKSVYYNNIATMYEKLNKFPEALNYYNKALRIYIKNLPENHPYIATTKSDIGAVYEKMGNHKKALEYQVAVLKVRMEFLRPLNHPDAIYSYETVMSLYEETGNYKKALMYGNMLLDVIRPDDENTTKALEVKLDGFIKKIDSQKTDKTSKDSK